MKKNVDFTIIMLKNAIFNTMIVKYKPNCNKNGNF